MFDGPIRGGTRGGHAEFKWSDVSADKDREHYLGHSINAPTGRWQKNKDVHWYNRDLKGTDDERREEIRRVKEAEAEALAVALGFKPTAKPGSAAQTTAASSMTEDEARRKEIEDSAGAEERKREKEERRKRKEEKRALKEEKHARKMEKKRLKAGPESDEAGYRNKRMSRSLSPPPQRTRDRSRSRLPYRDHSPDYRRHDRTPRNRSRSRSPARRYDDRDGHRDFSERRIEPIVRNHRR